MSAFSNMLITAVVTGMVVQLTEETVLPHDQSEELVPRIVDGQPADNGQFPWNIAIIKKNKVMCMAALITKKTALSSAYCIYNERFYDLSGIVGDTELRKGIEVLFIHLIPHEEYNNDTKLNDIGLLILYKTVQLSERIGTISLPPRSKYFLGKAEVAGWGAESYKMTFATEEMQWVEMDIIPPTRVGIHEHYKSEYMKERYILANAANERGPCYGDCGASLIYGKGSEAICIGLMKTGKPKPGKLEVFTATSPFADWIKQHAIGVLKFFY